MTRILRAEHLTEKFVYFIGLDDGPVKIGFSALPGYRLRELSNSSPFPLKLLALVPGCLQDEKMYHGLFSEQRLHGEWFSMSPDLRALIQKLGTQLTPVPQKTRNKVLQAMK